MIRTPLSIVYNDLHRSYATSVEFIQIDVDQTITVFVPDEVIEPIFMLSNPDLFDFTVTEKAITLKPKGSLGRCRVMSHAYDQGYQVGNLLIEVVAGPTTSVNLTPKAL